ncbi:MAG TPA: protein kinase [Thermoanaerobaculia bacterium]|nr:protein kinase [Thermoanaerobaculia bacterium]
MSATEGVTPRPTTSPPAITGLKLPPPEPPRFSLSFKIFFAAALLILVAVGGAIAISATRARAIADKKIDGDLKKSGEAWESFQQNRYGELQRALAVVANNPGIISMMTEGDAATAFDTLKREQASSAGAAFLIAIGPDGNAFARTDRPLPYSRDMRQVPTVAAALEGEAAEGIWLSDQKLYHVVAAPVLEGGSRTVGAIAAGFQIDDGVASSLKSLVNADVVFLADAAGRNEPPRPTVAASTMRDRSSAVLAGIVGTPRLVSAVLREGKTIGPIHLGVAGETYLGYFLPVRSSTDDLVGAAATLRSRERELAPFRQIQNSQVLVGLAALVFAFVLSFVLARRITGPVDRLVRATEAVRVGNLETEVPVESNDEIGILARSFRAMLEELKEKAALEKYVASLTMSLGTEETLVATRVQPGIGSPAVGEPRIGTLFAGRYDIQSVLGKGGMGVVYKALDRELDELVAIKTLRSEALSADPSLIDRFKQEIRLARRITHPNVLRTHDLGESAGLKYLSMEFVKGLTLKHLLESGQILPTPVGLRIAKQICAGLAAAHEVGVIHRDIKPQNILIEPTGGLKIMDFGIARLTEDRGMTAAGTVIGTPDYMSPEQARGIPLDFRSDIYSTGVVLYEIFTGSLPFEGDSPIAVVLKHVNDAPPIPQSRNPRIDPKIASIVMRCMEKEATARYQSVNELYEALARVTAEPARRETAA